MARISERKIKTGRKILLVDDNKEYLQATQMILEREGHDVLTAKSGPEALAILKKTEIELVLLDYFMPGMTGAEVVENLRLFDKHVQVILQTGYASEDSSREMVNKLDIQGYFDKSEGTEKLLLWTEVGLKSARTVQELNSQLLKDAELRAFRLSILVEISHAISHNLELDSLLKTVGRELGRVFRTDSIGISTYEEGSTEWQAAMFMENGVQNPPMMLGLDIGLNGYVIRNRVPLLFRSSEEILAFEKSNGISQIGYMCRSWMGVPLLSGDTIEGALAIQNYEEDACFDEADLLLFSMIGTQVSVAIKNAKLFKQAAEARAEAEEANKVKSKFLANTSHELRTPLNAIINFSWLLNQEDSCFTADQKDLLKRIEDSGHHLLDLINDILDLAKIEAGRMDMFPEELNLRNLIQDVFKIIETITGEKNLELRDELPPILPTVFADKAKLRQVLLNLLSNAAKFTDEGYIKVTSELNGGFLVVHVSDSGIGMSQSDISKLFNEFTQLESGMDRKQKGTGLGLSISKDFVELMGGSMQVESRVGIGSKFSFTVPLMKADSA